jgi:hypothetical protein
MALRSIAQWFAADERSHAQKVSKGFDVKLEME